MDLQADASGCGAPREPTDNEVEQVVAGDVAECTCPKQTLSLVTWVRLALTTGCINPWIILIVAAPSVLRALQKHTPQHHRSVCHERTAARMALEVWRFVYVADGAIWIRAE